MTVPSWNPATPATLLPCLNLWARHLLQCQPVIIHPGKIRILLCQYVTSKKPWRWKVLPRCWEQRERFSLMTWNLESSWAEVSTPPFRKQDTEVPESLWKHCIIRPSCTIRPNLWQNKFPIWAFVSPCALILHVLFFFSHLNLEIFGFVRVMLHPKFIFWYRLWYLFFPALIWVSPTVSHHESRNPTGCSGRLAGRDPDPLSAESSTPCPFGWCLLGGVSSYRLGDGVGSWWKFASRSPCKTSGLHEGTALSDIHGVPGRCSLFAFVATASSPLGLEVHEPGVRFRVSTCKDLLLGCSTFAVVRPACF